MRLLLHALGRFLLAVIFGIPPVQQIEDKQCIVVANHNTHIDILILFRLFPLDRINAVKVVAAKDYFSKGLGGLVGRTLFRLILVDRNATRAETAMAPILDALEHGESLIIFPEGTRGNPGEIQRFKTGIGKLALEYPDIPIYPVYLHGIERTLPKGGSVPVPFNIRVQTLTPLFGRDFLQDGSSAGRKNFTVQLEQSIRSASRQQ